VPRRTLLVTGFAPFGPHARNPSELIALAVDGSSVGDIGVVGRALPVVWDAAFPALLAAVSEVRPAALLMLGVAQRPTLCFEVVARNVQGPREDTAGRLPERAEVVPGGPRRLTGRLPWSRLETGPLPAVYSGDAGDYLCNHLLYRALHDLPTLGVRGFVHVPPLLGEGEGEGTDAPAPFGQPWPVLEAAGRALVNSLAEALQASSPNAPAARSRV
jgi:pyroglutamyl-peptidase